MKLIKKILGFTIKGIGMILSFLGILLSLPSLLFTAIGERFEKY